MPLYLFKCTVCGLEGIEALGSWDEVRDEVEKGQLSCPECGSRVRRDFAAENTKSFFHPTKSLRSWFSPTGKSPSQE